MKPEETSGDLAPVRYLQLRRGRKALNALSKMSVYDAMELCVSVIAELVDRQGLNEELAVSDLGGTYYRVDVRLVGKDEADAAIREGIEKRRPRS